MSMYHLKAENFWTEMRSTAHLFQKSLIPTSADQAALESELQHILGKGILNYPPTLLKYGIGPKTRYVDKKRLLALDKSPGNMSTNVNELKFLRHISEKAEMAHKNNWRWRVSEEAEQKQLEGWYPFFVTLTVDPKRIDSEQLWKEGREFRKYIRRLVNVVCQCLDHPPAHKRKIRKGILYPTRPESDYLQYVGVIEHGKSQEHHHGHFLIWMKEIPSLWKIDPNEGRLPGYRYERENKAMRKYWPWAIASQKPSLYYRSKGDIWSKLGHVTPIDKKTGKPIIIRDPGAAGSYILKYMMKGTRLWHHRMKATRNLGMTRLQRIIRRQKLKTVIALTWKPEKYSQLHSLSLTHGVPIGLVRSIAKRRKFSLLWEKKLLDLKTLLKTNYEHFPAMLQSVRNGLRPDRMPSSEFYDWVQSHLPAQKGYSDEKLYKAHESLSFLFPKKRYKIEPITIGGNQIGFTSSF